MTRKEELELRAFRLRERANTQTADILEALLEVEREALEWVRRTVRSEKLELTELAFKTRQSTDPRDLAIADCLYARVAQCEDILHRLD